MPSRRRRLPKATPPDTEHADYKAGNFFVFDDSLDIPDSLKSTVESHFFIDDFGSHIFITSAYPGRGELAVAMKVSPEGRLYGLVRKATSQDRRRRNGVFQPTNPPPVTVEMLLARLDAIDEVLAELRAQKPEHGGIGHNMPPEMLDPEIVDQAASASADVRAELNSPNPNPLAAYYKSEPLRAAWGKLKEMAERAPGQFVDGVMKEGGKLALGAALAVPASQLLHRIGAFLGDLVTWAHHMLP